MARPIHSIDDFLRENPSYSDPLRPIGYWEHRRRWRESREVLMWKAHDVAQQATSYRDFRVGCAMLAWRPWRRSEGWPTLDEDIMTYIIRDRWSIFTGMNIKPAEDLRTTCAEQTAITAVRAAGYQKIIGLVVYGEPQADGESGLNHDTLHPCQMCRRILAAMPEMRALTRVFTCRLIKEGKNEERWVTQEMTFRALLKLHGTNIDWRNRLKRPASKETKP